jgi:hypothetical protein
VCIRGVKCPVSLANGYWPTALSRVVDGIYGWIMDVWIDRQPSSDFLLGKGQGRDDGQAGSCSGRFRLEVVSGVAQPEQRRGGARMEEGREREPSARATRVA